MLSTKFLCLKKQSLGRDIWVSHHWVTLNRFYKQDTKHCSRQILSCSNVTDHVASLGNSCPIFIWKRQNVDFWLWVCSQWNLHVPFYHGWQFSFCFLSAPENKHPCLKTGTPQTGWWAQSKEWAHTKGILNRFPVRFLFNREVHKQVLTGTFVSLCSALFSHSKPVLCKL